MTQPIPEPSDVTRGLREQVFALTPAQIGVHPSRGACSVWGTLMETGYPEALITLVILADGTTSLYFGNGGGIIGGGEHEEVRCASQTFLMTAEKFIGRMTSTLTFPYPDIGRVKFYILTFSGIVTADADETELGEGRHELSKLFYAGHEVISQLRLVEEQKSRGNFKKRRTKAWL